jgi:hypothetical protein
MASHGGPEIPLQWLQEAYSIYTTKNWDGELTTISYAMIWALQSVASQFMAWDHIMVSNSGVAYLDQHNLLLLCQPCHPTNYLGYSMFVTSMAAQIGEQSQPLWALLDRYI